MQRSLRVTRLWELRHAVSLATNSKLFQFKDKRGYQNAPALVLLKLIRYSFAEELFTPLNPSIYIGLSGVEIFINSIESHAELRKLSTRLDLIRNCTGKLGGIYIYANITGIDGDARAMYDGSSMILCNERVFNQPTVAILAQA